jgi:DASS family divalent anion:Na+ symporter
LSKNAWRGIAVVCIGLALWFVPVPAGLKPAAWHLFAIFVATIVAFIFPPLPLGAIGLISLCVTALAGVVKIGDLLIGAFGNTTVWLVVSAFLFAKGLIKTGLGRRIAYTLIRAIGDNSLKVAYALTFSDLIIAPATPSNTARAGGVLFPITKSLCLAYDSQPGPTARRIGAYLMQSVFQGNAVTSAMFMTAMAANPLVATLASKTLNIEISWGLWALAASVPGLVSLLFIPYFLMKIYPPELKETPQIKDLAAAELAKMGPTTKAEKAMMAIFILALVLWATATITKLDATLVALSCIGLMLVCQVLEWQDIVEEKAAWDTLWWLGSLVALSGFLAKLGFIPWFAKAAGAAVAGINWIPALLVLAVIYMYAHYGFASLTAHVTAMYAAFAAICVAAGAPKYLVALILAYFSNLCANLTHYATGPAPIYFGAGYVDQGTWWKLGFVVSVVNMIIWIVIGGAWWKVLNLW